MVKKEKADSSNENGDSSKAHTSLFHHILSSETPESELSDERLAKEAQVRLERLHIYPNDILAKSHLCSRLQEELKPVMATYPQRVHSIVG